MFALEQGLRVLQPDDLNDEGFIQDLEAMRADFFVVVSYGEILPLSIIDIPRLLTLNLHASLLPRHRGAAPIPRAILAGEACTGVTIIRMVGKLDAGPIMASQSIPVLESDTAGTVAERLCAPGSALLAKALRDCHEGNAQFVEQDETQATYAPKIRKEDARIDWSKSARDVDRLVRAMNPEPGPYSFLVRGEKTTRCIIRRGFIREPEGTPQGAGGTVTEASGEGIFVAAGEGIYCITELQPAGKAPMSAADYLRGHAVSPGDRFVTEGHV
jgi:methionyl-tRNA formyltransferase